MVWFFMGEVKEQNGYVSDYGDRYKNLYVYHSVNSNSLQPNGSSIHGIFQARILEWAAISFSRDVNLYRC